MPLLDWELAAGVDEEVGEAVVDEEATRVCAWPTVVLLGKRDVPNSAIRATVAANAAMVMSIFRIVKMFLVNVSYLVDVN